MQRKRGRQGLLGLILTATGGQNLLLLRRGRSSQHMGAYLRLFVVGARPTGLTDDALEQIAPSSPTWPTSAPATASRRRARRRQSASSCCSSAPPRARTTRRSACTAPMREPTARACRDPTWPLAARHRGLRGDAGPHQLANAALAALSLAFFQDVFSLGYDLALVMASVDGGLGDREPATWRCRGRRS